MATDFNSSEQAKLRTRPRRLVGLDTKKRTVKRNGPGQCEGLRPTSKSMSKLPEIISGQDAVVLDFGFSAAKHTVGEGRCATR